MRPIPLPVRVAAGLVVTALEQARKFPEQLAELPVTAASRAVQTGMRVQQRVTQLAIKGDEVFSLFRPVEDTPPWARFDEDDEAPDEPHADGPGPGAAAEPNGVVHRINPGSDVRAVVPGPRDGHGEVDEADVAHGLTPEHPVSTSSADKPDPGGAPPALPGYDHMSLAQLRGKLRALSLQELEALLDHEHSHQDRAPFVTMLSNRIVTVRSR
ncbi:MAG: lipid droplet-associated protein [Pseudonocardiaceae bacterium]